MLMLGKLLDVHVYHAIRKPKRSNAEPAFTPRGLVARGGGRAAAGEAPPGCTALLSRQGEGLPLLGDAPLGDAPPC